MTSNAHGVSDAFAATSPESLTLCQLLAGVDMAGALLPPDVLTNIVGYYCDSGDDEDTDEADDNTTMIQVEDELGLGSLSSRFDEYEDDNDLEGLPPADAPISSNDQTKQFVKSFLKKTLGDVPSFQDANAWQRSTVVFPKITLDSITIDLPYPFVYESLYTMGDGQKDTKQKYRQLRNFILQEHARISSDNRRRGSKLVQIQQKLIPLPLKFTLECTIHHNGDDNGNGIGQEKTTNKKKSTQTKTLHIPLYSEIRTLQHYYPKFFYYDHDNTNGRNMTPQHDVQQHQNELETSADVLQHVMYSYDAQSSGAFLSTALALRYKCPVVITSRTLMAVETLQRELERVDAGNRSGSGKGGEVDDGDRSVLAVSVLHQGGEHDCSNDQRNNDDDDRDITKILPQWRSTSSLQSQSQRVVANIEQGFQVTKLQGALQIAIQKGDDSAAEKIRTEINKLLNDVSKDEN